MKKILGYNLSMSLLVIVFMLSCQKEGFRAFEETQVQIQESTVSFFPAAGGVGSIVIADSEQSVTAESNEDWCKTSLSGNTVTVTVSPNLNILGRTALITLKSGDRINYVPVSQAPVYLHLDSYETISFLGNGGNFSLPYECNTDVQVSAVTDAPWLTVSVTDGNINLSAVQNPDFLNGRQTTLNVVAGDDLVKLSINVIQGELMTSYEPDPDVNTVSDFLNRMNGGTYSRYRVIQFSPKINNIYTQFKAAYPIFQELRIQAPRSTYKLSAALINSDSSIYYWNATDGFVPIEGAITKAVFAFSGNSYAGTSPPYTSDANYTQLRAFFASSGGFTVFPDLETDTYWFRSVADPNDYFRVEPF